MLNVRPGLGITTHRSRIGSSLIDPSRFLSRRENIHLSVKVNALANPLLNRFEPLVKHLPLIQSAESQIGWNNWQPTRLERVASHFNVDRAELDSLDDLEIDAESLDPLTTIFNGTSDDDLSSGLEYLDREDGGESVLISNVNKITEFDSESRSKTSKISNQINRQESNLIAVGDRNAPPINDIISSEIIGDRLTTPSNFVSIENPPIPIDLSSIILRDREIIEADEVMLEANLAPDRSSLEIAEIVANSVSRDRLPLEDTPPTNIDLLPAAVRTEAQRTKSIPELPANLQSEKISAGIIADNLPQPRSLRSDVDLPPTIFHSAEAEGAVIRESPANIADESSNSEIIADCRSTIDLPTIFDDANDVAEVRAADNLAIDRPSSETISRSATDLPHTVFLPGNEAVDVVRELPVNFGDERESRVEPIVDLPSPAQLDTELPSTIWRDEIEVVTDPAATIIPPLLANSAPEAIALEIPEQPPSLPRSVPERADIALSDTIFTAGNDVELSANLSSEHSSAETEIDRLPLLTSDRQSIDLPPTVFLAASERVAPALALPPSLVPARIMPAAAEIEATSTLDLPSPGFPLVDAELPANLALAETIADLPQLSLEPEIKHALPPVVNEEIAAVALISPVNSAPKQTSPEPNIDNQPPIIFHEPIEVAETILPTPTPELASESVSPTMVVDSPSISQFSPDTAVIENIERAPTIFHAPIELGETVVRQSAQALPANLLPESTIDDGIASIMPTQFDDAHSERLHQQDEGEKMLPVKGYATGGQVADTHISSDPIHPSDTVAAMLTPKEFVINVRAAQKNINLLEHINSGGELTEFTVFNAPPTISSDSTSSPVAPSQIATKVESFADSPLQLNHHRLQRLPSLADSIEDRQSSVFNNELVHSLEGDSVVARKPITNYDSPSLIFRKPKSSDNLLETRVTDPPTQWNSVEDLLSGNDRLTTIFNFPDTVEPNSENLDYHDIPSPEVRLLNQRINPVYPDVNNSSMVNRFTNDDRVMMRDVDNIIEPITETIPAHSSQEEKKDDVEQIETLAREIYHRLRQRLEVERERQGIYNGRLPW